MRTCPPVASSPGCAGVINVSITVRSPGLVPVGFPTCMSSDVFTRAFTETLLFIQRRARENPTLTFAVEVEGEPVYWPDVMASLQAIPIPMERVGIDFLTCSIGGVTPPAGQAVNVPRARA